MNTDTPRTDAEIQKCYTLPPFGFVNLAVKLERELNAANKERDDALALLGCYKLDKDAMNERIKRLEAFVRDIASNYDHDVDAHRHGTSCRVCEAEEALDGPKAKNSK